MKYHVYTLALALVTICPGLQAQTNLPTPAPTTNAPVQTNVFTPAAVLSPRTNAAIIPTPRAEERSLKRTEVVLQRAKTAPGKYDLVFLGDSITELWERGGATNVWNKYYGKKKTLNLGVGGDRTEHVLWRLERGQLDGLDPKVTIILIGTNNSNKDAYSESEILAGVTAVVEQVHARLPKTKILLLGIFPRGMTFGVQRGKLLQVNQALAKLADDKSIYYLDFGSKLIEMDGSISKDMMQDKLHLTEKGYVIWAESMAPVLKKLL